MGKISFRSARLKDPKELQFLAQTDASIPSLYDGEFKLSKRVVLERKITFKKKFKRSDLFLVALDPSGSIVGYHAIRKTSAPGGGYRGEIYTLWVAPNCRKRGIAKSLKRLGEKWARKNKLAYLETWVNSKNGKVISFNRILGYETVNYKMRKILRGRKTLS